MTIGTQNNGVVQTYFAALTAKHLLVHMRLQPRYSLCAPQTEATLTCENFFTNSEDFVAPLFVLHHCPALSISSNIFSNVKFFSGPAFLWATLCRIYFSRSASLCGKPLSYFMRFTSKTMEARWFKIRTSSSSILSIQRRMSDISIPHSFQDGLFKY